MAWHPLHLVDLHAQGCGFSFEAGPFCCYSERDGVHVCMTGEISQWGHGLDAVSVSHNGATGSWPSGLDLSGASRMQWDVLGCSPHLSSLPIKLPYDWIILECFCIWHAAFMRNELPPEANDAGWLIDFYRYGALSLFLHCLGSSSCESVSLHIVSAVVRLPCL
jgi:hypothetical protein